ncbi:hypothetical protein F6J40_23865 [Escherichia coli]|nr:hypothetical protein [Escherichia coli]EFE4913919.1 hypothetical protein [Escherichia coli]
MKNWVIKELESLNVGDIRLEKRIKHVLSVLSRSPKESISVSCRTWSEAKAAYRCFSSDKISADKIMAPHKKNIIERTKPSRSPSGCCHLLMMRSVERVDDN